MSILTIILIAIGLTFDTFAVSVSTGITVNEIKFWQAVRVSIILAIFQASMPLLGWFGALQIKDYIISFDHWIAAGLLWIIGAKMIWEALFPKEDEVQKNPLKTMVVVTMAIATSIDALAVGVSFGFLEVNMYISTLIIGFTTFLVAMIGMLLGKKAGYLLGKRAEIIGGLILIIIGIKILYEHLS
jgi:manganese efflux pump family protein